MQYLGPTYFNQLPQIIKIKQPLKLFSNALKRQLFFNRMQIFKTKIYVYIKITMSLVYVFAILLLVTLVLLSFMLITPHRVASYKTFSLLHSSINVNSLVNN